MRNKISAHFDGIQNQILKELGKARYSIKVAMAWITSRELFETLVVKAAEGVQVELVLSDVQNDYSFKDSQLLPLKNNGGDIYKAGASDFRSGGVMHNKFCIIDFQTVITGSFNWTNQARKNDENILILKDREQAQVFAEQFNSIKEKGWPYFKQDKNDVHVIFSATKNVIVPGESFELSWVVNKEAELLELDNSLVEGRKGTSQVSIYQDHIFRLNVYCNGELTAKTLFVKVAKKPVIRYKVKYLHPVLGIYQTLPQKNFSDQYSAIEGQQIRLEWQAEDAVEVQFENRVKMRMEGFLNFNVIETTTKTLVAKGLLEDTQASFTIQVIAVPKLELIKSPMPTNLVFESKITFKQIKIPFLYFDITPPSSINIPVLSDFKAKLEPLKKVTEIKALDNRRLAEWIRGFTSFKTVKRKIKSRLQKLQNGK